MLSGVSILSDAVQVFGVWFFGVSPARYSLFFCNLTLVLYVSAGVVLILSGARAILALRTSRRGRGTASSFGNAGGPDEHARGNCALA